MAPRSRMFDAVLAAVVVLLGHLEVWLGVGQINIVGPPALLAAAYTISGVALAFRRRAPLTVLTVVTLSCVVPFAAVGSSEGTVLLLSPTIAAYTVSRVLPARRAVWAFVPICVLAGTWAALDPLTPSVLERLGQLVWMTPLLIAWLVGALVRTSVQARNHRRAERAARAERAVIEERTRIARELHDVVGHSLSVMIVQAAAARRRLHPDQAVERSALEAVEATGREALTEMRRLVGVLRTDEAAEREPPPGLAEVERLTTRVSEAGLPASVRVTGEPRELSMPLDITAYRVIQEGLTNALRHAHGASAADVHVAYGDDALRLAVRDDGRSTSPPAADAGSGLIGLRERVAMYGGTLDVRRHPEGGWEMTATLPWERS